MADETASILTAPEESDMIKTPYIDRLASIQYKKNSKKNLAKKEEQEQKKRIKKENGLARDMMQSYWQVELFLKTHFPDAFVSGEVAKLPQNEFKDLLRRSRNWLWKKAAFSYFGFLASVGSIPGSIILANTFINVFTLILFLMSMVFGTTGIVILSPRIYYITRVLLNKASYKNFKALESATKNAS